MIAQFTLSCIKFFTGCFSALYVNIIIYVVELWPYALLGTVFRFILIGDIIALCAVNG